VLTQWFSHTRSDRMVIQKLHPIAFTSKCTLAMEAKYKPFLLEFAALKFALDKFLDIIWGFPIEIKTNCQALHDTLLSEKPNTIHMCWRDSILAHQIINVRHVPGKINVIADSISHQWECQEPSEGDSSEWMVNPDADEILGLQNNIFTTLDAGTQGQIDSLQNRFKKEHLFIEVVDTLVAQDSAKMVRDQRCARHRASQYILEDSKLWKLHGGTRARART
jgi:hypothetical protein